MRRKTNHGFPLIMTSGEERGRRIAASRRRRGRRAGRVGCDAGGWWAHGEAQRGAPASALATAAPTTAYGDAAECVQEGVSASRADVCDINRKTGAKARIDPGIS